MEQIRFTRDLRSNSRVTSEAKLAAKLHNLFVKTLSKQQSNKFQIRIAEIFVARTTKHFLCWCTGKKIWEIFTSREEKSLFISLQLIVASFCLLI